MSHGIKKTRFSKEIINVIVFITMWTPGRSFSLRDCGIFNQPAFGELIMLKKILFEFLTMEGVTTAALVGRDGFVIEIVEKTRPSDLDALGALCSGSIRFFEQNGAATMMGSLQQILLEYRDGALILTPVSGEEFLAIITNTTAGLGHLTYTLARTSSRVAAVI